MKYFESDLNRKFSFLLLFILNVVSLVLSFAGILNLKITKGIGYAFTGNLLLASFTIFFGIVFAIIFITFYLKSANKTLAHRSLKSWTIFFIIMYILTFIILSGSLLVFLERNDTFRWYDGWWRNFGKL